MLAPAALYTALNRQDAAAMSGCAPAEDKLDEVGLVVGALQLTDFTSSVGKDARSSLGSFKVQGRLDDDAVA